MSPLTAEWIEKAEADVRTFSETAAGPVTVGLSHTAVAVLVLDVMQAVRARCPAVHLTLSEGLSPALIDRVLSGTLDLAICFNPPKDTRLTSRALLDEELYLVGRPEIIGHSARPVTFSTIPQGSVLGLNPIPDSRSIIQTQIQRNQIITSPTLEVDGLEALRRALEAGLGCAILARATVLADIAAGRIHARRITAPVFTRTLALVGLTDRPQTRAFTEVRQVLIDVVAAAAQSGRWPCKPAVH